jgi:hypothetical protein
MAVAAAAVTVVVLAATSNLEVGTVAPKIAAVVNTMARSLADTVVAREAISLLATKTATRAAINTMARADCLSSNCKKNN